VKNSVKAALVAVGLIVIVAGGYLLQAMAGPDIRVIHVEMGDVSVSNLTVEVKVTLRNYSGRDGYAAVRLHVNLDLTPYNVNVKESATAEITVFVPAGGVVNASGPVHVGARTAGMIFLPMLPAVHYGAEVIGTRNA
jgi:hypothetical protein